MVRVARIRVPVDARLVNDNEKPKPDSHGFWRGTGG